MIGILALLLVTNAASPTAAEARSLAAVAIFRDACTLGAVRLSAHRGRILPWKQVPDYADILDWSKSTTQKKAIRFDGLPSTYLVFADYRDPQPRSIAKTCVVVSRAISKRDATEVFLETARSSEAEPKCATQYCWREWTIDRPELGYRKRLKFRDDGSVLLEVATYARPNH